MMNILIDIGHPAHVHYYRNLAGELESRGHKIIVTIKDIPIVEELLNHYGISYIVLGRKGKGLLNKFFRQFYFDLMLLRICQREKIDLTIGTSITITHISFISGIKSIFFEDDDDEAIPLSVKFGHPFASAILSPDCLRGKKKKSGIFYYPGYHELAYLHPKKFSPDAGILSELNLLPGEKYFLMRFNALEAHHDSGVQGISLERKLQLVNILKNHGRIFITTEKGIEPELQEYQLPVSAEKIHSLMYYAHLFIGDSQTMTSEASMLGVPSLRCNSFAGHIAYLEEQENRYGLTFAFKPDRFGDLLIKLNDLLSDTDLKNKWMAKRSKMLEDKIDVTSFWLWFVENYPQGLLSVKTDPAFFSQFK